MIVVPAIYQKKFLNRILVISEPNGAFGTIYDCPAF